VDSIRDRPELSGIGAGFFRGDNQLKSDMVASPDAQFMLWGYCCCPF
jgi:hypothetical protein